MLFNSIHFFVFFPVVVLLYFILPKKIRYIWLLFSSYYFYMSWNAKYAILIAISTGITWLSGLILGKVKSKIMKNLTVAASMVSNLSILIFFKYFDFLLGNVNFILEKLNLEVISNQFDVILPVGISFYTFQALSYTMDVYRGEVKEEKNILKYALFVSFFPQLVAGPIERSKHLISQIDQIEKIQVWNYERVTNGLTMMLWGLFLKMVIADRAAILVNQVFNQPYFYGTVELSVAAICFAVQIYCDFSGYSTIAIGAAKVMGFDLMENFDTPYFSKNIRVFWKRWHISLSTWFRDYVYIPLGGNRCSRGRRYFNLFLTFLVSGLWHGASWTFVLWGGLHGGYQIIGDLLRPVKKKFYKLTKMNTDVFSFRLSQVLITFLLTTFAWIFFRANSVSDAFLFIRRLFTKWNPWVLFDQSIYRLGLDAIEINILFFAVCMLFAVDYIKYRKKLQFSEFLSVQNTWFRWAVIIAVILSILVFGIYGTEFDTSKFIYFDF